MATVLVMAMEIGIGQDQLQKIFQIKTGSKKDGAHSYLGQTKMIWMTIDLKTNQLSEEDVQEHKDSSTWDQEVEAKGKTGILIKTILMCHL
jgi:hypothetical protein